MRCRWQPTSLFEMQPSHTAQDSLEEFERVKHGLEQGFELATPNATGSGRVVVSVQDPTHLRLLEGVAVQLDLHVTRVDVAGLQAADLLRYELILTTPAEAQQLQARLTSTPLHSDAVYPAVISILAPESSTSSLLPPTDGSIYLPQDPGTLLAQVSVVLYAHRAFARRYATAMEELYLNRRIFKSVTSGISVADATQPDMPLTYVNPAFEVMTGYSLESVIGRNCRFLQRDERDQPAIAMLREGIAQRKQVTVTLRNYRKDGSSFWNELFISPIRNRDGELTHYVGIQNDVSARMEFEAALRQSEKLAAVGRLAASIAHEINNPLESVMNLLYLAMHEQDPAMVKHYLQETDNEVRRIALITTQSLRFYRQNTRPQATDCDDLLTAVLELYAPKLSRFNIETVHTRRAHTTVICMDSEIRQVLSNMVRNAIDAMRAQTGRLEVRTRLKTDWKTGRRGVALTLADTGSGMTPDVVKKLYTAFFTTKGDAGTGLGLWVSANIVERHQGRLFVRSSVGAEQHGTVFVIFLPFDGLQDVTTNTRTAELSGGAGLEIATT